MAVFALNNRVNRSTGFSPFYLNHGRHPNDGLMPKQFQGTNDSATRFADEVAKAMEEAKAALAQAQIRMKEYYDRHCWEAHTYAIGDKVWVEAAHITLTQPNKKLDSKHYGPFKIIKKEGSSACRVNLPPYWRPRLHPVFNESLLTPFIEPMMDIQAEHQPPPLRKEEGGDHFEVEAILDCREVKHGRNTSYEYLVSWVSYPATDNSWQKQSFITGAKKKVADFHRLHPDAPRPPRIRSVEFNLDTFPAGFFQKYGKAVESLTEPVSHLLPTEQTLNCLVLRARA